MAVRHRAGYLEFRILGRLEVRAGGALVALGGLREQKVLAMLLLEAGRVVPLPRLVDAVWPDDPPATAVKQVRNAVSRLRPLLAQGGPRDAIPDAGAGYRLEVGAAGLDARLFEADVAESAAAAAAGRTGAAARLLRSALDLWRGPALDGLDGRIIEAAAAAWDERRRTAQEAYHDYQLALGSHQEIISELTSAVREQPLREKPVAQLMLALYRCGRQAEALAQYQRTRTLLTGELGLDPGRELQQLHQQILRGEPALDIQPPTAHGPAGTGGTGGTGQGAAAAVPLAVPRQLPTAVRHFAGRADELKALDGLLDGTGEATGSTTIAAIDGTAGIGKTTLAVYWAHRVAGRFPDGQLHVNLRGFDPSGAPMTPAEAIRGFLDALAVPVARIPATFDAQVSLYRSALAGKRVLVIVDNARDAAHARPLIPGSGGCLVVVTSRTQLAGLVAAEGAHPLTLGLLTGDEARDLLARSAGADRVDREPAAAGELIELCARLPLALGIAAARATARPQLTLASMVADLHDRGGRLDALDAGDPATSLRPVFSWSYAQLSEPAARMFRLLAVHPGPDISIPAAASLAGTPRAAARSALAELTRASLLAEPVSGRFSCHDLLRAYAAEEPGDPDGPGGPAGGPAGRRDALHRALDHYLHTARAGAMLLNPARQPLSLPEPQPGTEPEPLAADHQALAWYEAEHSVLLAMIAEAASAGFDRYAWQLPSVLADFFDRRGLWADLAATQQTALAAARRAGDQAAQAFAHRALARTYSQFGAPREAHPHLRQALELYQRLGDPAGQAHAHHDLGMLAEKQGHYAEALDHAEQALRLVRAAGGPGTIQASALNSAGWCHALVGNLGQALAYCEQALDLHRELGYRHGEADTWDSLGYIHHRQGNQRQAVACYRRALDLHRELGDRYYEAVVLRHLGDAHLDAGDPQRARAYWRQALVLLEDLDHPEAGQVLAQLSNSDCA